MKIGYLFLILVIVIAFWLFSNYTVSRDEVSFILSVIGLFFGMFSALVINDVWEKYSKVKDSVILELSNIDDVLNYTMLVDKKAYEKLKDMVIEYLLEWIYIDWNKYSEYEKVHNLFEKISDFIIKLFDKVDNMKEIFVYIQLINSLSAWDTERENQLVLSSLKVTGLHWILLITTSIFLVIFTILSSQKRIIDFLIISSLIIVVFLIILVIKQLDALRFKENELFLIPHLKLIKKLDTKNKYKDKVIKILSSFSDIKNPKEFYERI